MTDKSRPRVKQPHCANLRVRYKKTKQTKTHTHTLLIVSLSMASLQGMWHNWYINVLRYQCTASTLFYTIIQILINYAHNYVNVVIYAHNYPVSLVTVTHTLNTNLDVPQMCHFLKPISPTNSLHQTVLTHC